MFFSNAVACFIIFVFKQAHAFYCVIIVGTLIGPILPKRSYSSPSSTASLPPTPHVFGRGRTNHSASR